MKNKNFDQELKSELEDYQSSADPAAIWAAIGSDIDQINETAEEEKKRPIVWIFGLFSIGLLMVLAMGWNINTNDAERGIVNDFDNKIEVEEPAESKNKASLAISNFQDLNIFEKKNEKINESKLVAVSSISNTKKTAEYIFTENNKTNSFTPSIQNGKTFVKERTPINNQNISTSGQDFSIKKEGVNISKKINKPSQLENDQYLLGKKISPKKQFLTPIVFLENDQLIDDPTNKLAGIITPEIIPTSSFADRRRRRIPAWSLGAEIQGGASMTNRKLSSADNESSTYLSLREATESVLETIQIGGKLELQHRTGFSISTGIQWSRITEKYTIEEKIMEDRLENTLVSYSLDMNQDTVNRSYDDILRTRTTTTTREGFNRYRLLDIPLLVGYHFKKENWSIGLETGILANLNLSTEGFVYDENSQLVDLDANQKTVFKTNVGMSFYLGATGRVALTEDVQITVSPFYRWNAGSFTISEGPISQKYSWLGLNVGVRYGF